MISVSPDILAAMTTQTTETVLNISQDRPVLLVFLRHFGCQFCREALDDLSKLRPSFTEQKIELIFVHMAENDVATAYFQKFNLDGVLHVSDVICGFYTAFGLIRANFTQMFGLQSWIRGFSVQAKYGAEIGKQLGDNFQMPGAFMIYKGDIYDSYIHKKSADRPDYNKLANCCILR